MNVTIEIKGADKLFRGAENEWRIASEEIDKATEQAAIVLQRQAKLQVPVQTGRLQKSIKIKNKNSLISATAKYASFVHEGTRAHTIKATNKKVLANKKTGQVFGKIVRHPGTQANPFMTRAVDTESGRVKRIFEQAVKNINKRVVNG